jgi:hypothetical protein
LKNNGVPGFFTPKSKYVFTNLRQIRPKKLARPNQGFERAYIFAKIISVIECAVREENNF